MAARKRLEVNERIDIVSQFLLGVTVPVLASKYTVTERQIEYTLKKAGAKRGAYSHLIDEKVKEALARKAAEDVTAKVKRVTDARDETERVLGAINKLIAETLTKARAALLPMSTTLNDVRALLIAAQASKTTLDGRFKALGVKDDGNDDKEDLPTLAINEMTAVEREGVQKTHDSGDDGDVIGDLETAVTNTNAQAPVETDPGRRPVIRPSDPDPDLAEAIRV